MHTIVTFKQKETIVHSDTSNAKNLEVHYYYFIIILL